MLFQDSFYLFKHFSLSGVLFYITQENCSLRQAVSYVLYCILKGKHTRRHNGDIIKLCFQECFGRMRELELVWLFV